MPWVKLTLLVKQNKLAITEELLLESEVQSITVSSESDEAFLEHALHEVPEWSHVRVEALFALHEDLQAVFTTLSKHGVKSCDVSFVGDQDWQCASALRIEPMDFGGLSVVPRGSPKTHNKNTVQLEPGLAFGTGKHPTTSMCLTWLAAHPPQHLSVLDFGTGSGILGIASKVLGATEVDAIDIDPLARQTALNNAQYNEVDISVAENIPLEKRYDLISVNILLHTILEFAPRLVECLNPDGVILLTGLLQDQTDGVKSAYAEIEFIETFRHEEWSLLVGEKKRVNIWD